MFRTNTIFRFLLFPLGAALLIAVFVFQEGTALSTQLQSTPSAATATLSPFERLAEPTLPAAPAQADFGAQTYWLLCLPCHGDRGQGLTEEFRETYPPEEQYCWERGCHGERPYEFGFTLPMKVPAVIGSNAALGKFTTAARLNAYIMAAMPYWKPGSLTQEEGWLVTAFILRENGIVFNEELDDSNAEQVLLAQAALFPTTEPDPAAEDAKQPSAEINLLWLFMFALIALIVLAAVLLRRRSTE